jgi:hypothetical protein
VTGDTAGSHSLVRSGWATLVCVALLPLVTWSGLLWVLREYVPMHASVLAGLGWQLPRETLVTIAVSTWFVRLLPIGIVTVLLVAPLLACAVVVVLARLLTWSRIAESLGMASLVATLLAVLGCGFLIASIQEGYAAGPLKPRLQEDLDAFRAERGNGILRPTE